MKTLRARAAVWFTALCAIGQRYRFGRAGIRSRISQLFLAGFLVPGLLQGQSYYWSNLAGSPVGARLADGVGANARFQVPAGVACDAAGNVYIADSQNHAIRKMTPAGVVTTIAGSGLPGAADGLVNIATFNKPVGIAVDSSGNLFVTESGNFIVRKISSGGVVSTIAGLAGVSGTNDGPAALARFSQNLRPIVIDGTGNLLVGDGVRVRQIDSLGNVSTVAGTLPGGYLDGPASQASFRLVRGFAFDSSGNLYIADLNNALVRKLDTSGNVTTVAGTPNSFGGADGPLNQAKFSGPRDLGVAPNGSLIVRDDYTIRVVDLTANTVNTIAGTNLSNTFAVDGTGTSARFSIGELVPNSPVTGGSLNRFCTVDSSGNIYTTDGELIRKVTLAGVVTTIAGAALVPTPTDGLGSAAKFGGVYAVAADTNGNAFAIDKLGASVRRVSASGSVTTFAGPLGVGSGGFVVDGVGQAARFTGPVDVVAGIAGNVFVLDSGGQVLRQIDPVADVTTVAGHKNQSTANVALQDGNGTNAFFNTPSRMTSDANGNLLAACRTFRVSL